MRFTTKSGAKYELAEVEGVTLITRDCDIPILGMADETVYARRCSYIEPPTVGERFRFGLATGEYITTTAVESVEP